MWFGGFFWYLILFPVVLIFGTVLAMGVYAFTGNSLIDMFAIWFNRSAKLTCWHCGKETPSDQKTCRHCGEESQ